MQVSSLEQINDTDSKIFTFTHWRKRSSKKIKHLIIFLMRSDWRSIESINSKKNLIENLQSIIPSEVSVDGQFLYIEQLFVDPNYRKNWLWREIKRQFENDIDNMIEKWKINWSLTRNLPKNVQPYTMNINEFWYTEIYQYPDWRVILFRN